MAILGIENRAENWKTAHYFSPMFRDRSLRLKLVEKLGGSEETDPRDVHMELFWKGMRDHLHQNRRRKKDRLLSHENVTDLVERFNRLFPGLRERVKDFEGLRDLRDSNYDVSTKERKRKLAQNLLNTEIDVVLSTTTHLYIGETKYESVLRGEGDLVLVHQLIREYIMAEILIDRLVSKENTSHLKIVPFIVMNAPKGREQAQIEFMKRQRWMEQKTVLTWRDIKCLVREG